MVTSFEEASAPFKHESRVLKECRAASELGWQKDAMAIALWEPGLEREEVLDDGVVVWRVELKTRNWRKNLPTQVIKYLELIYRIVKRMRRRDITIIHTHSVAALPIGVALKWATGAPHVYDAHELESEANGLSRLRGRLTRWMERLFIKGADRTITVCDSIADWYASAYGMDRPAVDRNVPMKSSAPTEKSTVLRDKHDVPDTALLYLYQGALAPGRGIEMLLDTFASLADDKHLVLMGYGVLEDQVVAAADASPNIHFQPAVPPGDVLYYTTSADVGLCLIENTCLSYYYSLPNKLFEYLLSGLPVLVNDMPEQRSVVERYECGWVVPPTRDEQVALIGSIDRDALTRRQAGAARAADAFDWANEATTLRTLYTELAA